MFNNDLKDKYPFLTEYFGSIFEKNIETEHEKMFKEQGIKIKAAIAKKK